MAQKGATRRAGVFGGESEKKKPGDQVSRVTVVRFDSGGSALGV